MTRGVHSVQHHAYVSGRFTDIARVLQADGATIVEAATRAAAEFAADLADYLEDRLGFFDADARVHAAVTDLIVTDRHAILRLEWSGDERRRLLPNVEALIDIAPIISSGSGATTELTLLGTFVAPRIPHGSMIEHALARRVVDATLHTFLRRFSDELGERCGPAHHSRRPLRSVSAP